MRHKKITAPGVTSTQSGGADSTAGSTSFSISYFSTAAPNRQAGTVEQVLIDGGHVGRENAIDKLTLATLVGIVDGSPRNRARKLQAEISREVADTHALIVADGTGGGYFVAKCRQELVEYKRTLIRRGRGTFERLKAVNEALKMDDDQITFFTDTLGDGGAD